MEIIIFGTTINEIDSHSNGTCNYDCGSYGR